MENELTIDNSDHIKIIGIEPDYRMDFHNEGREVGTLDWNDGTLKFSGNIAESADIFLGFLKPHLDEYVANKLKSDADLAKSEGDINDK